MNAFTKLCLHTTADVLEQIVIAIRGTETATAPTIQPITVHVENFNMATATESEGKLATLDTQRRRWFGAR